MSYLSSINFKKSNDFQVFHNSTVRPTYALGGSLEYNIKGYAAKREKEKIIDEAKQAYASTCKAKNKAFQAKNYEWSAVVNIKPETTMQDLEKLAKHFSDKYKFQCYQIAIHRDEGHINDKSEKVINHHAHLEFITLDKETGKQIFKMRDFTPQKMREIQSEVAEILGMTRGQDKRISGAKRIEPRQYAQMKEQERANTRELKAELESKAQALTQAQETIKTLNKKEIKEQSEAFRKAYAGKGLPKEFFREYNEVKKKFLEQKLSVTQEQLDNTYNELLEKYAKEKKGLFGKKVEIDYRAVIDEQQKKIIEQNEQINELTQIADKSISLTEKAQDEYDKKIKILDDLQDEKAELESKNAKLDKLIDQEAQEKAQEITKQAQDEYQRKSAKLDCLIKNQNYLIEQEVKKEVEIQVKDEREIAEQKNAELDDLIKNQNYFIAKKADEITKEAQDKANKEYSYFFRRLKEYEQKIAELTKDSYVKELKDETTKLGRENSNLHCLLEQEKKEKEQAQVELDNTKQELTNKDKVINELKSFKERVLKYACKAFPALIPFLSKSEKEQERLANEQEQKRQAQAKTYTNTITKTQDHARARGGWSR